MNERIAKLYDQAIVIEDGGDYVCGELDPVKFAELIVTECIAKYNEWAEHSTDKTSFAMAQHNVKKHFGVEL
jgi:hypothetical protein